jgi:hypothetical protein
LDHDLVFLGVAFADKEVKCEFSELNDEFWICDLLYICFR